MCPNKRRPIHVSVNDKEEVIEALRRGGYKKDIGGVIRSILIEWEK